MNYHPSSQIILQASCPSSAEGSFSLDDVHIIRGTSCDEIIPTTTPDPVTMTTAAPASAMDCTFEQGDAGKSDVQKTLWLDFVLTKNVSKSISINVLMLQGN